MLSKALDDRSFHPWNNAHILPDLFSKARHLRLKSTEYFSRYPGGMLNSSCLLGKDLQHKLAIIFQATTGYVIR